MKKKINFWYTGLTLPALLLSGFVVFIPAVITFYAAFTDWNGIGVNMTWVGTKNFVELFDDRIFWKSLGNNFKWTLMFISIPVLMGLISAFILMKFKKSRNLFQTFYIIPYVLAPVTNAVIWLNIIFSPISGIIGVFRKAGIDITAPLGNIKTALAGVAMVDIWHYWGFLTIIYLGALRQTPIDQIEAFRLESKSGWQLFRFVYLPNIMPTIRLMFVMIVIYSFLTFDYVYLLTWGGPAHSTEMLSTFAYSLAFSAFKFGKAAAVSLVMGFFGVIAAFFYTWLSTKEASA